MCFCFFVPRIMYVFSLPVFIAKAIGSFANLPCKREDCCLAVNSLECQTSILFIKSVIGQVISLQLAVLLISSHFMAIVNNSRLCVGLYIGRTVPSMKPQQLSKGAP